MRNFYLFLRKYPQNLYKILLELVFPRRCPVCDSPVRLSGSLICPECREKIRYIKEPKCKKCGKALYSKEKEYCFDCSHKLHFYTQGLALYEYSSMQDSIYRFKYASRCEYAGFYAWDLKRCMERELGEFGAKALIPVPIHKERRNQRGYNQAEILALELARQLGIPMYTDWVIRKKKTVPQKELTDLERQNNLKRAFLLTENVVKLDTIILIDDIYTTGSTIDEIAKLFLEAGVKKIYYVALAIGKGI